MITFTSGHHIPCPQQINSVCVPHYPVFFPASHYCPFFGRNIFSILMSSTFGLYYSFNTRDQASHPYRTTGKITFLCNLIFVFQIAHGRAKGYGQNRGRHCPKLNCMKFVSVSLMSEPCNIFKVFVRCLYMTAGSCVPFMSHRHLGLFPFLSIYVRSPFLLATNNFVLSYIVFVCLPSKVTTGDVSDSQLQAVSRDQLNDLSPMNIVRLKS